MQGDADNFYRKKNAAVLPLQKDPLLIIHFSLVCLGGWEAFGRLSETWEERGDPDVAQKRKLLSSEHL